MAKYNKANDIREQQGNAIARQMRLENAYPGGRMQMLHDEIRAHRRGKLFIRPSDEK